MKYSLKETAHLLELHSSKNDDFIKILSEVEGSGLKCAIKVLHMRFITLACDSSSGERWLLKPDSFTRTSDIEDWLSSDEQCHPRSKDLLEFFKASTYKKAIRIMINVGLLHLDKFNKISVKYPIDGKMLSLSYAAKSIKASYKKVEEKPSLDISTKESVSSKTSSSTLEKEKPFWEQD